MARELDSSLRDQILRLVRLAVLAFFALLTVAVVAAFGQYRVLKLDQFLRSMQTSLQNEVLLQHEFQGQIQFIEAYSDDPNALPQFYRKVANDMLANLDKLRALTDQRAQTVEMASGLVLWNAEKSLDLEKFAVPEQERQTWDWLSGELANIVELSEFERLEFQAPFQLALIRRAPWFDRTSDAIQLVNQERTYLGQINRRGFFVTIGTVLAILLVLLIFAILPAIRKTLAAEKVFTLRGKVLQCTLEIQNLFESRERAQLLDHNLIAEEIETVVSRYLPTLDLTISVKQPFASIGPESGKRSVTAVGGAFGEGRIAVRCQFDKGLDDARDSLKLLADKIASLMTLANNIRARNLMEQDRDTYFSYVDTTMRNMRDGLALFDADENLLMCNPPFSVAVAFLTPDKQTAPMFRSLDDLQEQLKDPELVAFLKSSPQNEFEVEADERFLAWWKTPLKGGGWLVSVRDVSDERRRQNDEENSRRLEVLGRIAGGVAHDLNNILGAVMSNVELARDNEAGEDEQDGFLRNAIECCEQASLVNEQLLAYSRRQPLLPELVSLEDLSEEITYAMRMAGRDNDLILRLSATRPLWADRMNLFTSLQNLLENAVESSAESTPIEVTLQDDVGVDEAPAIRITIRDYGKGFDDIDVRTYLEPFFSTKKGGSGLGLSAAEGFAVQSNGRLSAGNNLDGTGAYVSLVIPAAVDVVRQDEISSQSPPSFNKGNTVLLVEDNPQLLRASKILLTRRGFDVMTANCLEDALSVVKRNGKKIGLLVTDILLGDGTGFSVARAYLGVNQGGKVIYISGFPSDEFQSEFNQTPGTFLPKPFRMSDLDGRVREALAG